MEYIIIIACENHCICVRLCTGLFPLYKKLKLSFDPQNILKLKKLGTASSFCHKSYKIAQFFPGSNLNLTK